MMDYLIGAIAIILVIYTAISNIYFSFKYFTYLHFAQAHLQIKKCKLNIKI